MTSVHQVQRASNDAGIAARRTLQALHYYVIHTLHSNTCAVLIRLACRRAKFRACPPLPDDAASRFSALIGSVLATAAAAPPVIGPTIGSGRA